MRFVLDPFMPILLTAFICLGICAGMSGCDSESTSSINNSLASAKNQVDQSNTSRTIIALGRLHPTNGVLSVSAIPGERLATLNFREGDLVDAGVSLGKLASYELHQLELETLNQNLLSAKAKQNAAEKVADARIKQAAVVLAQAKQQRKSIDARETELLLLQRQATLAKEKWQQLSQLFQEDPSLVSLTTIKQQKLAYEKLQSDYKQAKQKIETGKASGDLAIEAAQADIAAANAAKEQLKATDAVQIIRQQIKAAKLKAQWSSLPTPTPGTVLKVFVEPGEFIAQTPILQIANIDQMACIAEVYVGDLQSIQAGNRVTLKSDAFQGEFAKSGIPAKVKRLGRLIGSPALRSLNPMARIDPHVVEVVLEIDPENFKATQEAARLVGLQVTIEFDGK